jgi:hypothetical protein
MQTQSPCRSSNSAYSSSYQASYKEGCKIKNLIESTLLYWHDFEFKDAVTTWDKFSKKDLKNAIQSLKTLEDKDGKISITRSNHKIEGPVESILLKVVRKMFEKEACPNAVLTISEEVKLDQELLASFGIQQLELEKRLSIQSKEAAATAHDRAASFAKKLDFNWKPKDLNTALSLSKKLELDQQLLSCLCMEELRKAKNAGSESKNALFFAQKLDSDTISKTYEKAVSSATDYRIAHSFAKLTSFDKKLPFLFCRSLFFGYNGMYQVGPFSISFQEGYDHSQLIQPEFSLKTLTNLIWLHRLHTLVHELGHAISFNRDIIILVNLNKGGNTAPREFSIEEMNQFISDWNCGLRENAKLSESERVTPSIPILSNALLFARAAGPVFHMLFCVGQYHIGSALLMHTTRRFNPNSVCSYVSSCLTTLLIISAITGIFFEFENFRLCLKYRAGDFIDIKVNNELYYKITVAVFFGLPLFGILLPFSLSSFKLYSDSYNDEY